MNTLGMGALVTGEKYGAAQFEVGAQNEYMWYRASSTHQNDVHIKAAHGLYSRCMDSK